MGLGLRVGNTSSDCSSQSVREQARLFGKLCFPGKVTENGLLSLYPEHEHREGITCTLALHSQHDQSTTHELHMPRISVNEAQHKIIFLLKTLGFFCQKKVT